MGIVELISNAFGAAKEFFGFARDRNALKNAPDVKAAKVAQNEVNAEGKIKTDVARKDTDEIRQDLAE